MRLRKFISELSRRNVFKAVIAYLAIAWVIVQIASIVLPAFGAPEYSLKIVIYFLSAGLVLWIGFSWAYDLTSEGFKKTENISDNEEFARITSRRLNKVIGGSIFIAILLLIGISFWAGSRWNQGLFINETKKVAVLPFVDNTKGEEEYFITGMTDALIEELSKVDELTVINQQSTKLLSASLDLTSTYVSDQVKGIEYFVNGSIERNNNTLKVHVELKESLQSKSIWSKDYSDDMSKVRSLWVNVTEDLTRQMGVVVKPGVEKLWTNLKAVNPETYELYLKGKHYLSSSNPMDWNKGLVYLEEARDKNPGDSYAYSGLAEGYVMLGHAPAPSHDVFPKAQEAALRSIQLDSTNANGWAALAHYHTYFGQDWELAEYAFNRANELNPNLAYNHYHRAWYLALFGRMNEAIEEHILAQQLDPFTPMHTAWLGELYRCVGMYDEGLAEIEKVEQMRKNNALGMFIKGKLLLSKGDTEQGIMYLKQGSQLNPLGKYYFYGIGAIESGDIDEGMAMIRELESMAVTPWNALCLGQMYLELGDLDNALKWFEYEEKHAFYPWIRVLIYEKGLQQDPRFLKLVHEMNLPDPAPLIYDPFKKKRQVS